MPYESQETGDAKWRLGLARESGNDFMIRSAQSTLDNARLGDMAYNMRRYGTIDGSPPRGGGGNGGGSDDGSGVVMVVGLGIAVAVLVELYIFGVWLSHHILGIFSAYVWFSAYTGGFILACWLFVRLIKMAVRAIWQTRT